MPGSFKQLSGIVPPMATPLLDRDRLDHAACDRLLQHMLPAGVAGVKDSSGDLGYFQRVVAAVSYRADFGVFCGPEELVATALTLGARGGVTGGANLFPRLYVDLYNAFVRGDGERVARLQPIVD